MIMFLFLALIIGQLVTSDASDTYEIQTKNGPIVGLVDEYDGQEVVAFLGVPYAEPPVNNLRFKRPKPAKPRSETLYATKKQDSCMQPRLSVIKESVRRKMSEDCLYLNIIVTKKALLDKKNSKSVMVWIGPWGNLYGAGTDYPYLVPKLSITGDVIVVTVDYRKNIFGFAYSDKIPGLDGNLGLWDQNMAFNWVQKNIKSFNGDPQSVTAFGNEVGSQDIANHILSPYGVGLFQNAILQSAPAFDGVQDQVTLRTKLSTEIIIKRVDCYEAKDVLKCLQDVPAKKLIDAIPRRTIPLTLVFGDEYLPYTMQQILDGSLKTYNNRVNILIGYMAQESSEWVASLAPYVFANSQVTPKDAEKYIATVMKKESVPTFYKEYIGDAKGTHEIQKSIIDFTNDAFFRCPIYNYADIVTSLKIANVYSYIINHRSNLAFFPQCTMNPEFGACSADDILYVFGVPFDRYNSYTDNDRKFSAKIMNIWTDFAKSGKAMADVKWPNWEQEEAAVVLNVKNSEINKYYPKRCQRMYPYIIKESLPKLQDEDRYTIEVQEKLDAKSSFAGFLYDSLATFFYNYFI